MNNHQNLNRTVDFTAQINELANQYGLVNSMGLFTEQGTTQRAIVFDKVTNEIRLLPQSNRQANESTYGKDRKVETFSLALPHFLHSDRITPEDIEQWRKAGTEDDNEALAEVRAEKLLDLRLAADQTKEFMKISALKGVTVDPEGTVLADMFSEFGVTQKEIDFVLGTASTNVDQKIAELKRYIGKEAKAGGRIGKIMVLCAPSFFDKLVGHATIRDAYNYYLNSGRQVNRDDLSQYEEWGIVDTFEHKGVMFMSYDAEFIKPDGSAVSAFAADEGFSVVSGVRNLYRGYNGAEKTLSGVQRAGSPMYAREHRDPRDRFYDLEVEMSPLYFMERPLLSVKVTSSN
jgi:hypothetical protein